MGLFSKDPSKTTARPWAITKLFWTGRCSICLDFKWYHQFARGPFTSSCTHWRPSICKPCLQRLLSTYTRSGDASVPLRCPEPFCKATLSPNDVLRFGTTDQAITLASRFTTRFLFRLPEHRHCLGPGCGEQLLHAGDGEMLTCYACGLSQCYSCQVPWHAEMTCEEYQREAAAVEGASEEEVRRISKRCPNCTTPIESTGGCAHMVCGVCRFEFCYDCGYPWQEWLRNGGVHPCAQRAEELQLARALDESRMMADTVGVRPIRHQEEYSNVVMQREPLLVLLSSQGRNRWGGRRFW